MSVRMYLTICPLHGPGSIPDRGRVFQGIIPAWSHVLPFMPVYGEQKQNE